MEQTYQANGVLTVHFKIDQIAASKAEVILNLKNKFKSVLKLDGDLYLKNGCVLPMIADKLRLEVIDVIDEYEL